MQHHLSPPKSPRAASRQQGATLLEVLITMLVVAIGLLGIAGLQLASARFQQTSSFRTQALQQADFIIEKMRVNNGLLTAANLATAQATPSGAYLAEDEYDDATLASLPNDPSCGLASQGVCTPTQSALRDLREWRQNLARDLPGGRGSLFPVAVGAATEPNARLVVVMWREKTEAATDNAAGAAAAEVVDGTCPGAAPPAGIRCLSMWVTP